MTAILEPESTRVGEKVTQVASPPEPVIKAAPAPEPVTRVVLAPPPAPPRVRPVLSARGVRLFGAAMIGLYALGVAVEPAPNGPQPVAPWWAEALSTVAFFGLLTVFAGSIAGRRWALWTGQVTGASLLALSASCPVEGHHEIAAWWFVQMAVAVAMTVLPATLLRRTQAGSRAG
jgi:hypothetical protein